MTKPQKIEDRIAELKNERKSLNMMIKIAADNRRMWLNSQRRQRVRVAEINNEIISLNSINR